MDKKIIYEKVHAAIAQRFLTNCYTMNVIENAKEMWTSGDELLLSCDDNGVNRLYFFIKTWDRLNHLIAAIESGRYFLEYVTRNKEDYRPQYSELYAAMKRMSNTDCQSVFEEKSPVLK